MTSRSLAAWLALAPATFTLTAAEVDLSKLPPAAKKTGLTYAKDIKPIFEASCLRCHGADRQRGDLRLDSLEAALKGGETGKVIEPGKSEKSLLVIAAAQLDEETAMPPKRPPGGGPGGGGGNFQPPAEAVKRFDKDGDGNLSDAEREAMRAEFRGGGGPGGAGGDPGGPPPKPLTAEQVGLVRAWIDQGAK